MNWSVAVLRFQQGSKTRNYFSHREQRRLLFLVLTLGLVVFLMFEARDPGHYDWLTGLERGGQAPAAGGSPAVATKPVDTRVNRDDEADDLPGTFLSSADPKTDGTDEARYFPGVRAVELKSIRDDRLLGPSEWDTWLHLFEVLRQTDESSLEQASTGRVTFVQLFEQSPAYRGELVTVSGTIRRAHPTKTPANDLGLTDYYQTWLQPADHPQDPMAVWTLSLPERFPTGMDLAEEAEATGFYFKRLAYKAADGEIRRAPLLLARNLKWIQRPPVVETPPQTSGRLALMIAGAAVFAVLATALIYYRSRNPATLLSDARARAQPGQRADTSSDVGDALRRWADSPNERTPRGAREE